MSRRRRRHDSSFEEPTINLTALIDVVFVILIMFILVAPLLEVDRVELASSSAEFADHTISASEQSPITIQVRQDNSIWFNQSPVTARSLSDALRLAKQRYPNARPQLIHDKRAHFGTYQSVKNATEAAGFQQMDVVLKPG